MRRGWLHLLLATMLLLLCANCGGGSPGTSSQNSNPPQPEAPPAPERLSIVTIGLPQALEGAPYKATFQASGGTPPYKWSAENLSLSGLSLASNGEISGSLTGSPQFRVTVLDSASPPATVTRSFSIGIVGLLKVTQTQFLLEQYTNVSTYMHMTGGADPLSFSIVSGKLPPGLALNPSYNRITGVPITQGIYQFSVRVRDSFSPPQEVVQPITAIVGPAPLQILGSVPGTIPLGAPFSGVVMAIGGTPPYTYVRSGVLPTGVGDIDQRTGRFSGTPTFPGSYTFDVMVTDSGTPTKFTSRFFGFEVVASNGRNDTIATATPVGNGSKPASISPYMNPPNTTPFPGDVDYYKLRAKGGSIVRLETRAERLNSTNPLDTMLEVVDANNQRMNVCQLPGDASGLYTSPCLNDDLSSSPHIQDSALDFRAPGTPDAITTFYARVFDWRGDARPDMTYDLVVQGVVEPLLTAPSFTWAAIRGRESSQAVPANGGIPPVQCCTLASGTLPPGLMLVDGKIQGTATTTGKYLFALSASDSGNPAEIVVVPATVHVVDPLMISSSAILPDACLNRPYSFIPQVTGGLPGYAWTFTAAPWPLRFDPSDGTTSGTPTQTGIFTASMGVRDATSQGTHQTITLAVKLCP